MKLDNVWQRQSLFALLRENHHASQEQKVRKFKENLTLCNLHMEGTCHEECHICLLHDDVIVKLLVFVCSKDFIFSIDQF